MDIRRKPPNPSVRVEDLDYSIPHKESKPRNILEEIVWYKDIEINNFKKLISLEELVKQVDKLSPTKNFTECLRDSFLNPGIIAEIKKASPSKGIIRKEFKPKDIASAYQKAGATCLSVLTDNKYFQGSYEILSEVRKVTSLPILCKDFIISPYQIYKARVSGADAILLIAKILNDSDIVYLKKVADKLNLDVLIEIHNLIELERVLRLDCFSLIGINNRDLKTFETDLQTTIDLMENLSNRQIKENILFISESGIKNKDDLKLLNSRGIKGVLVGETLMKQDNISEAFKKLIGLE